jgi:hypothetical protein
MNLNESCGIVAFITKSCPGVVQALYFLSLKSTFKYIRNRAVNTGITES